MASFQRSFEPIFPSDAQLDERQRSIGIVVERRGLHEWLKDMGFRQIAEVTGAANDNGLPFLTDVIDMPTSLIPPEVKELRIIPKSSLYEGFKDSRLYIVYGK